ncbi:MAG: hypothetical protein JNK10_08875 [Cyclobacteriaceae bacterium]|nr:hypothetical protein [Cyclobacteriaceae bacterium]
MKGSMLLVLSAVGLMVSCDIDRVEISRASLDSLRNEVTVSRQMSQTLAEVGALIDSIDANRSVIRTNMLEGASYATYTSRMVDINQYVKKTEARIVALERTARKSTDGAYKAVIKRLRADLDQRNHEVAALKETVEHYRDQNSGLVQTVSLQKAELEDKLSQIKAKQIETAQLQDQVAQLVTKARIDQGEALYARATAVEETAKRTHFAPKKKKQTQKEALELYKLALFYGKEEAVNKISALEKVVL